MTIEWTQITEQNKISPMGELVLAHIFKNINKK